MGICIIDQTVLDVVRRKKSDQQAVIAIIGGKPTFTEAPPIIHSAYIPKATTPNGIPYIQKDACLCGHGESCYVCNPKKEL